MQLLLKDQAYQALLEMIWSGNLEVGEIYSLTKIAQDLNISRTPLRDAIQRLSDENVLISYLAGDSVYINSQKKKLNRDIILQSL